MRKRFSIWMMFVLCVVGASAQINTKRMMEIGRNAIYFEDYVLSIQYFNRIISAKPYLADPYFYRAVAKISLEDYTGAEVDCGLALERNPFVVDAYRCRGAARTCLGKYEEALSDFEKGLELEPHNKIFRLFKGSVYACQEKWDTAIVVFSDLIKLQPHFQETYLRRGYAYFSNGDTLKALQDFESLLALDRYSADGHAARGYLLGATKDYKRGIAELNEAIRLEPYRVGYYINRGAVWAWAGDSVKAVDDYDVAIQLDPTCVTAYFNRAIMHTKMGNKKLALEDYDKVVDLEPGNYFAIYNRAILCGQMGRYKAAIRDLGKILEEYPDYYPAYQMRAEIKMKMKDKQGAEIDYNTAYVIQRKLEKRGEKESSELASSRKKKQDLDRHGELVVMDKQEEMRRLSYKNESRGRVQNVNFHIELSPMLLLSAHPKENKAMGRTVYFDEKVNALNAQKIFPLKLSLSVEEEPVGDGRLSRAIFCIDSLTKRLEQRPTSRDLLIRAVCHEAVSDYQSAFDDLSAAIDLGADEYGWLAHFLRGVLRYKRYLIQSNMEGEEVASVQTVVFDLMQKDFEQAAHLKPNFAPAWYNCAHAMVAQRKYAEAVQIYDRAIEHNPNLAEAYYNRGLTHIYMKNRQQGISDLSKAGELGLYSAYNVIKRFGGSK